MKFSPRAKAIRVRPALSASEMARPVGAEMVAMVAPSGTGKSTLLHTAGLLERPDAGDVILGGRACGRLSDDERTAIRRNDIGFVYQFHHLLPEFSALENIMMPQLIKGLGRKEAAERAAHAGTCVASLKLSIPTVIDRDDNAVNAAYAGWPDRLYVVGADGKIAYKGGPGPAGFKPAEVEDWLRKNTAP